MPLQQRWPVAPWAALEGVLSADQGSVPFPLLSMGEATPGILCPVVGSPVPERHGRTGESLARATKVIMELEKRLRTGTFSLVKRGVGQISAVYLNI